MFSRSVLVFAALTIAGLGVFVLAARAANVLLLVLVLGAISAAGATLLFHFSPVGAVVRPAVVAVNGRHRSRFADVVDVTPVRRGRHSRSESSMSAGTELG